MKAYLLKLTLFASSVLALLVIGYVLPDPSPTQSLHYSILDKHAMLRERPSPRIVLVGGSNLSFGIISPMIQKRFGANVINTAINAGYGLQYILDDVSPYIRQGDVIVLAPEYSFFFGHGLWGGEALLQGLQAAPQNYALLSWRQGWALAQPFPKYASEKLKGWLFSLFRQHEPRGSVGVYERRSFNAFGDVVAHWGKPRQKVLPSRISDALEPRAFQSLLQFQQFVKSKNATLVVTFPCLSRSSFALSRDKVRVVERRLRSSGLLLVGSPERYSMPDRLYFNTNYHLTREGAEERTRLLIEDLATVLPRHPDPAESGPQHEPDE